MDPDPPHVPPARLDGWRRVEATTEQSFAAGPVSVTASTVRFEPVDGDGPSSFFFASRLRIRPATDPNPLLTRLVEKRARAGFRERLADNDITDVDHRGDREIRLDDADDSRATLSTFRGRCPAGRAGVNEGSGACTVSVEALLAVRSDDDYLLAGGAYPLTEGADRDRRDLLRLIRGVRSTP